MWIDIGDIVAECRLEAVTPRSLPTERKYTFLKTHSHPDDRFVFPTTYMGGCNRSFQRAWLDEHKWLVYSTRMDGGFCMPCALFNGMSNAQVTGKFITRPFKKWNKKTKLCKSHELTKYHQTSLSLADDLVHRVKKPETTLPSQIDQPILNKTIPF